MTFAASPKSLQGDVAPPPQFEQKQKALEKAEEYRFTPHISAEAFTRPKGKFSFQRSVGANLNTNLLLSSFTYAISNRVEIGTVFGNYFYDLHQWNFTVKYNFWRTKQFLWSLGYSFSDNKLDKSELDPSLQNLDLRFFIGALQLLFNYLPENLPFKFGVNYNVVVTNLNGLSEEDEESLVLGEASEFGLDISYSFSSYQQPFDITLGLGWLRQDGVTALEDVEFGFGLSLRWYRPKKLLSSPTVGAHYSPDTGAKEFLFSSSFY